MTDVQKVPLYSVNDLKNATDDALAPYLTKLPAPYKFRQSHRLTEVRLGLGYSAVAIGAATFYADWKLGWEATKTYTAIACILYFILNSILTYWIWFVEKGTVFVGVREGGQKLTLRSSVQKFTTVYNLKVRYEAPSGQIWQDEEIKGKFVEWFNDAGLLQHEALKQWLAQKVEVVGQAQAFGKSHVQKIENRTPVKGSTEVETPSTKTKKPRKQA